MGRIPLYQRGTQRNLLLVRFSSLFAGHKEQEDIGPDGTPANNRWHSTEHPATVFGKTQATQYFEEYEGYIEMSAPPGFVNGVMPTFKNRPKAPAPAEQRPRLSVKDSPPPVAPRPWRLVTAPRSRPTGYVSPRLCLPQGLSNYLKRWFDRLTTNGRGYISRSSLRQAQCRL